MTGDGYRRNALKNFEKFKDKEMRGQRVKIDGWIQRMDNYLRSFDGEAECTDAHEVEFVKDWFSDETQVQLVGTTPFWTWCSDHLAADPGTYPQPL